MSQHSLPPGLKELLNELESYAPAVRRTTPSCCLSEECFLSSYTPPNDACLAAQVPDEITQYAMRQSGYDCKDVRT